MEDYILFIDTETGGIPKDWDAGYDTGNNWPFILQIAWILTDKHGKEIRRANHYVWEQDIEIDPEAYKIHGISKDQLKKTGMPRRKVFQKLYDVLEQYKPLIVSHFLQLDESMVRLGFYRSGLTSVFNKLHKFCTMKVSHWYIPQYTDKKYLKLGELFHYLFQKKLIHEHDAMVDASATKDCFFEMLKRGDITEKMIKDQQMKAPQSRHKVKPAYLYLLAIGMLFILLLWYMMGYFL